MKEPVLKVGIIEDEAEVNFHTVFPYRILYDDKSVFINKNFGVACKVTYDPSSNRIKIFQNQKCICNSKSTISIHPEKHITVSNVKIGRGFHWQRSESQTLCGIIQFLPVNKKITVINLIPLEKYLVSVISSEMKSTSHIEYLKAHAVISRSWVLNQLQKKDKTKTGIHEHITPTKLIRWYERSSHKYYDFCNDDHCQRYHGFEKTSQSAEKAVEQTKGEVLKFNDEICDARFHKVCGGWTENYENVWENREIAYLKGIWDGETKDKIELADEEAVEEFISNPPKTYCNVNVNVLKDFLVDFDKETRNFYRWKIQYTRKELRDIINKKANLDIGEIVDLIPLKRGRSGRIILLKIIGTKKSIVIGKELEIRKILSPTCLLSSCFFVKKTPDKFIFHGAGWGHGVGLCQIGAANMSLLGFNYKQILQHYYPHTTLERVY